MCELLGLGESVKFFSYLMLSFAFFIGIMLIISREAVVFFSKALSREMGFRKRVIPGLEDKQFFGIDNFLLKYRFYSGVAIAVCAFVMLLICK